MICFLYGHFNLNNDIAFDIDEFLTDHFGFKAIILEIKEKTLEF
jgi:hypothetical protein